MKIKLTKDMRINHKAGEIIEISPAVFKFLKSVNAAVQVETPKKGTKKK